MEIIFKSHAQLKTMTKTHVKFLKKFRGTEVWKNNGGMKNHAWIQRGLGQGVRTPPPPENHKNEGFLSNTGPDPLANHKATKPAFNVGPSSARQRN